MLAADFFPVWGDLGEKTATAWETVRPDTHLHEGIIQGAPGSA
jgi:hypothetical protein